MKKDWVLTQEAFDTFLTWLSPEREEAARKYEKLHRNLITLFDYRGCENPDLLADEVINRVAERLTGAKENEIQSLNFVYGVARLVYLEQFKKRKFVSLDEQIIVTEPAHLSDDSRQECMKHCLNLLDNAERELLFRYYGVDAAAKAEKREQLSAEYRISLNNLRVKVKRLREKLQNCQKKCLDKNKL